MTREAIGATRPILTLLMALCAFPAAAQVRQPVADPSIPKSVESAPIALDHMTLRLVFAPTGALSEPLGGLQDPKFVEAQKKPWNAFLVDIVLRGPPNMELTRQSPWTIRVGVGNGRAPEEVRREVPDEYISEMSFGSDGLAHVPVLVRGRFYSDVKVSVDVLPIQQDYWALWGFNEKK